MAGRETLDTLAVRRDDRPAWLHWGLGEGFPTQTRASLILGGLLVALAVFGFVAIVAIRF